MSWEDNQLNNYLQSLDDADDKEQAISELADSVYSKLLIVGIIKVGSDTYSLDDFISDFDIDSTYFASFMRGNGVDFYDQAQEKLTEFSTMIATKLIDSRG